MGVFCQDCGNELASQYKFCPGCGSRNVGPGKPNIRASSPLPQTPRQVAQPGNFQASASTTGAAYAGFWRRGGAMMIDYIIVTLGGLMIGFLIGLIGVVVGFGEGFIAFLIYAIVIPASWFYYAGMESSAKQATLGKRMLGLIVCDMNGQRITRGRATKRLFSKFVSTIILYIGFIMAAFTERKQALHDKMVGTVVLYKQAD